MIFDIVAAVLVVYSLYRGVKNGFVVDLVMSIALIIGLICGYVFMVPVGNQIFEWFNLQLPVLARTVGFFVTFSAILVVGGICAKIASLGVSATGLSATDRSIGGVFGLLRGIVVSVVLLLIVKQFPNTEAFTENSWVYPYLEPIEKEITPHIEGYLPTIDSRIQDKLEQVVN